MEIVTYLNVDRESKTACSHKCQKSNEPIDIPCESEFHGFGEENGANHLSFGSAKPGSNNYCNDLLVGKVTRLDYCGTTEKNTFGRWLQLEEQWATVRIALGDKGNLRHGYAFTWKPDRKHYRVERYRSRQANFPANIIFTNRKQIKNYWSAVIRL